jgi:hypothetical protein
MTLSQLPINIAVLAITRSDFPSSELSPDDKLTQLFYWKDSKEGAEFWQSIDEGNFKVFELRSFVVDGSPPVLHRQEDNTLMVEWGNFYLTETDLECLAKIGDHGKITAEFENTVWDNSAFFDLYDIVKSVKDY